MSGLKLVVNSQAYEASPDLAGELAIDLQAGLASHSELEFKLANGWWGLKLTWGRWPSKEEYIVIKNN